MEQEKLIIGTRGSELALWQAHFTQGELSKIGIDSELKIIKTRGDQIQHLGFDKMEGKGFFTKEIEDALLRGDIHLAVHSMKDMPTQSPEGLCITAVSYRADPRDVLLVRKESVEDKIFKIKTKGIVGTSSARRKAQILRFRPDVIIQDIRGNVPTRIKKLEEGNFDAILLAAAGIERLKLDLSHLEVIHLNPKEFVPAPAQGVLAFQTLKSDIKTRKILQKIHHSNVSACTNVERKVLNLLDGGCQMPLGAYCECDEQGYYHLWVAKADNWDSSVQWFRLSSNTTLGLAENAFQKLNEE